MVGRKRKSMALREPNGRVSRIKSDDAPLRDVDVFLSDPTAIYVTECGPMVKIGVTRDPSRRSIELQTANGQDVRLAWYRWMHGKDARALEKAIHDQHRGSTCHARGEWYYLNLEAGIDLVERKTRELGLYAVWEKYSAFVERPIGSHRNHLANPFTGGLARG